MDEKTLETIRIAAKALDDANKLNRHIIKWGCTLLISLGLICGTCFTYFTYVTYNYDYTVTSENVNKNLNENINKGE